MKHFSKACALTLGLVFSASALADLRLDSANGQVNFISVKNEHIAETHSFDEFTGALSTSGALSIEISLSSVNTLIPIRNERMQKMLFDVANFSKATFNAQVDPKLLSLKAGEQVNTSIDGELTISGKSVPTSFDVQLTGLGNGAISASTNKPTVLSTSSFGLDGGVTALQEIAMLNSISKTVPLTFSVVFK